MMAWLCACNHRRFSYRLLASSLLFPGQAIFVYPRYGGNLTELSCRFGFYIAATALGGLTDSSQHRYYRMSSSFTAS
ncbi:hypothetical protein PENSPDRAFT_658191 [Peniophora sp. CONT]|nr:hypothetical protein PENSPDRAFT_658191 [Peniophora sp. CONT]